MELKDTVEMMESGDYKERFKAEYYQLKIRREKLGNMVGQYYAEELPFTPTSPIKLLERQLEVMKEYLDYLGVRACIEGIDV